MKPNIIAVSGKARHGKDTFCDMFIDKMKDKKVLKIGYADYLKHIAERYLGWDGKKDEKGRTLLQDLGVSVREKDENFWVDTVIRLINVIGDRFDYVLINDCRFPNEIKRWQDITTVRITRTGFESDLSEKQKNHISETALDDYKFNYRISARNLKELEQATEHFIEDIILKECL